MAGAAATGLPSLLPSTRQQFYRKHKRRCRSQLLALRFPFEYCKGFDRRLSNKLGNREFGGERINSKRLVFRPGRHSELEENNKKGYELGVKGQKILESMVPAESDGWLRFRSSSKTKILDYTAAGMIVSRHHGWANQRTDLGLYGSHYTTNRRDLNSLTDHCHNNRLSH